MVCNKDREMLNMPGQVRGHVADNKWTSGKYDFHQMTRHPYLKQKLMDTDRKQNDDKEHTPQQQPQMKREIAESTTNVFDLGLDLSPYIREELKITIQRKRAEKGLKEINVEENEVVHYDLSEDEMEKKKRRRERNKIAAAKLRHKNKLAECSMREEYEKQSDLNKRLKHDVERFEREKASILESLNETQSKQLADNKSVLNLTCFRYDTDNTGGQEHLDELYKDIADNSNRPAWQNSI